MYTYMYVYINKIMQLPIAAHYLLGVAEYVWKVNAHVCHVLHRCISLVYSPTLSGRMALRNRI